MSGIKTIIRSIALLGIKATICEIEITFDPTRSRAFEIAPTLDKGAAKELRVRVRSALSDLDVPLKGFVSVGIRAPGASVQPYDLPVAVVLALHSRALSANAIERGLRTVAFLGELSLAGDLRRTRGVYPRALAARDAGMTHLVVSCEDRDEAALVPGLEIISAATLTEAVGCAQALVDAFYSAGVSESGTSANKFCLSDIRGQEEAKAALERAATTGAPLLIVGPLGSGKTMLARRAPGILPTLTFHESRLLTTIYSASQLLPSTGAPITDRPFRAPHHTISDVGLIGRGGRMGRPGEATLAHHGVLFLDELAEFRLSAVRALGYALKAGQVTHRCGDVDMILPTRPALLIASAPSCPCGNKGNPHGCRCSPEALERYKARLDGMCDALGIEDRVELAPQGSREDRDKGDRGDTTAVVRARVSRARSSA